MFCKLTLIVGDSNMKKSQVLLSCVILLLVAFLASCAREGVTQTQKEKSIGEILKGYVGKEVTFDTTGTQYSQNKALEALLATGTITTGDSSIKSAIKEVGSDYFMDADGTIYPFSRISSMSRYQENGISGIFISLQLR
jgi:long-subunit fatty acid transport protein